MSRPRALVEADEALEPARLGEVGDPARRGAGLAQRSVSCRRLIVRSTLRPQVVCPGLKRSVLNGIAISAAQPSPSIARRGVPDAVPVEAHAPRCCSRSARRRGPRRVHGEEEPVALVEERVEDHEHVVVDVEVRVAGELRRDDARRRAVAAEDPEVERVVVAQDPDLGGLLGGAPSTGSRCMRGPIGAARAHAGSSSTPSSLTGPPAGAASATSDGGAASRAAADDPVARSTTATCARPFIGRVRHSTGFPGSRRGRTRSKRPHARSPGGRRRGGSRSGSCARPSRCRGRPRRGARRPRRALRAPRETRRRCSSPRARPRHPSDRREPRRGDARSRDPRRGARTSSRARRARRRRGCPPAACRRRAACARAGPPRCGRAVDGHDRADRSARAPWRGRPSRCRRPRRGAAGGTPSATAAFHSRAPSTCTAKPASRAAATTACTSSTRCTVPPPRLCVFSRHDEAHVGLVVRARARPRPARPAASGARPARRRSGA